MGRSQRHMFANMVDTIPRVVRQSPYLFPNPSVRHGPMRFRDGIVEGQDQATISHFQKDWIPDLKDFFAGTSNATIWNWLGIVSDISVATAFSKLFWPDFLTVDSGIFLREVFDDEAYRAWKERLGSDYEAIEKVINHVHVWDLFLNPRHGEPSVEGVKYLGRVLARLWSLKAQHDFGPGRIVVELFEDDPEEDPTIVLYQVREG